MRCFNCCTWIAQPSTLEKLPYFDDAITKFSLSFLKFSKLGGYTPIPSSHYIANCHWDSQIARKGSSGSICCIQSTERIPKSLLSKEQILSLFTLVGLGQGGNCPNWFSLSLLLSNILSTTTLS